MDISISANIRWIRTRRGMFISFGACLDFHINQHTPVVNKHFPCIWYLFSIGIDIFFEFRCHVRRSRRDPRTFNPISWARFKFRQIRICVKIIQTCFWNRGILATFIKPRVMFWATPRTNINYMFGREIVVWCAMHNRNIFWFITIIYFSNMDDYTQVSRPVFDLLRINSILVCLGLQFGYWYLVGFYLRTTICLWLWLA